MLLTSALQLQAQDAFYIYRNDGHFNAFFNETVDSIVYSQVGVDGTLYKEFVVQEVYTADSLYRIPLASIDSVSFVAPEVVLNADVQRAETVMATHLQQVNGMTLTFSNAIPEEQKPQVGQILLNLDHSNPMIGDGFAGRVTSVRVSGSDLIVECDSVSMSDIFDQFIGVEEVAGDGSGRSRSSMKRIEGNDEAQLFDFDISLQYEFLKTERLTAALDGHIGGGANLKAVWKFTRREQFLEMTLTNTFNVGAGITLEGELFDKEWNTPKTARVPVYFPAAVPILKCDLSMSLFLRLNAKAAMEFTADYVKKTAYTVTYKDGDFSFNNETNRNESGWNWEFGANFSLEGSVHTGAKLEFYLGTVNLLGLGYAGAAVDVYAGPKITGTVDVNLAEIASDTRAYDMLKDSRIDITAFAVDVEAKGKAKYLWQAPKEHTFYTRSFNYYNVPVYLFPEFSELTVETWPDSRSARIGTAPTRNIIFPLHLGIGLYDEEGNLVKKEYDERKYWIAPFFNYSYLESHFNDLGYNEYTARPIISFLGCDVAAHPSAQFKLGGATATVKSVVVNSATYDSRGYTSANVSGSHKFKYLCTVTTAIDDLAGVEKWGYIYIDPNGNRGMIEVPVNDGSTMQYADSRNFGIYLFDSPAQTIQMAGFVKYYDDDEIHESPVQEFTLEYPAAASLELTNCEFKGTTSNETFNGVTYKYKTAYRFLYKATGAYWLKVGQQEFGTGWDGWTLPKYTMSPIDGANALTINYYYGDKSFGGVYNVRLTGDDATHGINYITPQYVTYSYYPDRFDGCTFRSGTNSRASRPLVLLDDDSEAEEEYNIVIDIPIK